MKNNNTKREEKQIINILRTVGYIVLVMILLIVVFGIRKCNANNDKKEKLFVTDIKGCRAIGDSYDGGKYAKQLRTIYKCPDGMMRIR